jgi:4-alpha-glucanotransferase
VDGAGGRRLRRRQPLHALRNSGYDVSPYSPITRLFRNPLYIAVENIPSSRTTCGRASGSRRPEVQAELAGLRDAHMIDYGRVMAVRAPILDALFRTFLAHERAGATARGRAYAKYVEREDPQLTQFATFMAISEREGPDARQWPEPLRDANGAAVAALRTELAERVDFHRWLQFELDRQLGCVASTRREQGWPSEYIRTSPWGRHRRGATCGRTRAVRPRGDGRRPARHVLRGRTELGTAGDRSARAARDGLRLLGPTAARRLPARGRAAARPRARAVPDVLGADRRPAREGRS